MKRYEINATWTHVVEKKCDNTFELLAKNEDDAHNKVEEMLKNAVGNKKIKHLDGSKETEHREYMTDEDQSVSDIELDTEYEEVVQQ